MNEAEVFAGLLIAALLGWGITLALMTRATIPHFNAISVLEKLDDRMDTRINTILSRAKTMREQKQQTLPQSRTSEPEIRDTRDSSGYSGGAFIGPQPGPDDDDDAMEIVS